MHQNSSDVKLTAIHSHLDENLSNLLHCTSSIIEQILKETDSLPHFQDSSIFHA